MPTLHPAPKITNYTTRPSMSLNSQKCPNPIPPVLTSSASLPTVSRELWKIKTKNPQKIVKSLISWAIRSMNSMHLQNWKTSLKLNIFQKIRTNKMNTHLTTPKRPSKSKERKSGHPSSTLLPPWLKKRWRLPANSQSQGKGPSEPQGQWRKVGWLLLVWGKSKGFEVIIICFFNEQFNWQSIVIHGKIKY